MLLLLLLLYRFCRFSCFFFLIRCAGIGNIRICRSSIFGVSILCGRFCCGDLFAVAAFKDDYHHQQPYQEFPPVMNEPCSQYYQHFRTAFFLSGNNTSTVYNNSRQFKWSSCDFSGRTDHSNRANKETGLRRPLIVSVMN